MTSPAMTGRFVEPFRPVKTWRIQPSRCGCTVRAFFWTDILPDRQRFTITIQDAEPRNPVPLTPRLRRLLKTMLRGYGIRVTDMRPVPSPASQTPPEPVCRADSPDVL